MSATADQVVGRFQRQIVMFALWSIPAAFLIETLIDILDDKPGYAVRWYIHLGLFLVAAWQRRRASPSVTVMLLFVVGFIALAPFLEIWTGWSARIDSATTMVVVVVLGIYLTLTVRRIRWFYVGLYLAMIPVLSMVTGSVDGLDVARTAIRASVATLLLWIGASAFWRLKTGLLSAIGEADRARTRSQAAAGFSEALLLSGPENLAEAAEALRNGLGLDSVTIDRVGGSRVAVGQSRRGGGGHSEPIVGADGPMGRILVTPELDGHVDVVLRTVAGVLAGAWERADALARLQEHIRTKDQLVASVSHELRTPLTGILGFTETILDLNPDIEGDMGEFIGLIHDQSQDMSDIIEDLLASARADIGTLTIHSETFNLTETVDSVLTTTRIQDLSGGKTVEVDSTGAMVIADPLRCRQIVRNLLTNAFRYGGQTVLVTVGGDDEKAWVEVADDGPRLSGDERNRLFEPYFRAKQVPTQPGSVGLGLAVSRHLARLMGGDVELLDGQSGTTFRFSLAVAEDAPSLSPAI